MIWLAITGEEIEKIAWANLWNGLRLLMGFIHLADVIEFLGILLSSSMYLRVSSSSRAVEIGMNWTTMLKSLSLMLSLPPVAAANLLRLASGFSHSAASLLSISSKMPPFLSSFSDRIFMSGSSFSLIVSSAVWKRVSISSLE